MRKRSECKCVCHGGGIILHVVPCCEGPMEKVDSTSALIDAIERAPQVVVPLVREVPAEILKRRPAPGKWSAHEHACHLAVVHKLFFDRLDYMLANPAPVITPYNPGSDDPDDALLRLDLRESLDAFVRDRARLVSRLRTLAYADWARAAEHPEYSHYSVFIMFRHLALHDFFHAYRIEELLLKRDWPQGIPALLRQDSNVPFSPK
jgi:DinB family protein